MHNRISLYTRWFTSAGAVTILLATAVYSFHQISQGIPLFNHSMRIGEPWHTQNGKNIYHPADYYLEKSQQYLARARTTDTKNNLEGAVKTASQSLETRPNNAYAWVVLGTAYAALSRPKDAQKAFIKTYDLAPYHRKISLQRLQVLQAYWTDLTPPQQELVLRDIRNLQFVNSWRLRRLARLIPFVQTLIDQINAENASQK